VLVSVTALIVYSVGVTVVVAAVAIALYHGLFAGRRIAALEAALRAPASEATPAFVKRTEDRLAELESLARVCLYRVGFVRFSSFTDSGPDLSYALALINAEGDGIVLTSIYSREESRTFGKRVRRFNTEQEASKEEQDAIAAARATLGS